MKQELKKQEPEVVNFLLAVDLALKWKRYRDIVYDVYKLTNDLDGFTATMAIHQAIIKNFMLKNSLQIIEAVTAICQKEDDARRKIKYLAAAYDLCSGVEHACS